MMNKRITLMAIMLLWGFTNHSVFGQGMEQAPMPVGAVPDEKMLQGTATGAGFSGIASPNLFNGSMNINVPIYNFEQNGIDYGVSLSYNTQGVKVDEFATMVGLHWNLNSGATITRIIRDLPDELLMHGDSLLNTSIGWYPNIYDTLIVNKEMHIYGRLFTYVESSARLNAPNAYADHESDEFVVSLFGRGFKFYIGEDLKIFTTSPQNYKIELLADNIPVSNISQVSNLPGHTLNIKITDNKGVQYIFQSYSSEAFKGYEKFWDWQQISSTPYGQIPRVYFESYPVSWRLQEVVFADGQTITYKYGYPNHHSLGFDEYLGKSYHNYFVRERSSGSPIFLGINAPIYGDDYLEFHEIVYPNGVKVNFEYNDEKWNLAGRELLKEIRISSGENCKRFRLYQDSVNKRYYLDSIRQVSCDGSLSEPYYSFDYNRFLYLNVALPGQPPLYDTIPAFPKRLNTGQDLFGYYNGDSIGTEISNSEDKISIPKHNPPNSTNYGNERGYNATFAQAGLLNKVRNAYGKEQRFVYAPITLDVIPLDDGTPTSDPSFVGVNQPDGVRIDSIISTDPAHPYDWQTTTFSYSGGQIFMAGGYFHYPTEIDSTTGEWKEKVYQSMFLTPHQLINGANHGFSKVEIENYSNSSFLSRRVITYTNMQDETSDNEPRFFRVPGSKRYFEYPYTNKQYLKDWEIGLPLTITDYDQNNRIIKKVTNKYNFSPVDLSASSFISNTRIVEVNMGTPVNLIEYMDPYYPNKKIFTDNYYPFKGKATLTQTITQKYVSDTRFVADTVWYAYDSRNNLSSTITQDSKGEKTATQMIYNYDVDGSQYASPAFPGYTAHPGTTLYNLTEEGLELAVSTERWKLLPGTNISTPEGGVIKQQNDRLLSSFITGYHYENGKLWTKSLWNSQNGSPLSYTDYTGLIPGVVANPYGKILGAYNSTGPVTDFIKTSSVTLFNMKGNPLETQLQEQNQYKAMVWDTATGQKLAEAANCRYSDIAYTSFEGSLEGSNLTLSSSQGITTASDAVTGSKFLYLWDGPSQQNGSGTAVTITGTQNLKAGKSYTVSFWVSVVGSNPPPTLSVGTQNISLTDKVVYTKGNWKKYLVKFTPDAAGKIKITGTSMGSRIDEIRLFPSDAQMQSWTYEPLFGISSQTDPSGRIIYYRYDKMGRQNLTLDMDGNILSKTNYEVAQ